MNFVFPRAVRSLIAAGALAVFTSLSVTAVANAQAAAQPGGQQAGQKNYKDRGEYDLYSKVTQTQDPKERLQLLNTWQDKYPQTDFSQERLQYFVATLAQLAPNDPQARTQLLQKANDLLKVDPKNFQAMYYTSLFGPGVGGTSCSSDVTSQVQTSAQGVVDNINTPFDASKKPQNMSQADFDKAKNAALAIAHNALAWVDSCKKDNAGAENEYKASLQANPDQGNISAAYAKLLYDDKKTPDALFEYARAAEYTGPGPSLPPATRTQLQDFFNKAYQGYHGGTDGADQILNQAKTDALPPAGFNIVSANQAAQGEADKLNARIQSDPGFKIWYAVEQSLQQKGDAFFNSDVKDAEIPGGAQGVKWFKGTVISLDPPDAPTKVVLGVQDEKTPDATLLFSKPLTPDALNTIKPGSQIEFSGVADSYTANPYMLTFKDPSVNGVQTAAPPKKGTTRRHK
ncbi:MAG: hypothetical protein JO270_27045 [Acidobacteriaceae bacterium]|nr:hypothetical protein [Acidobacteriaceae bacterium]